MPINNSHRIIFFHICKTGGSSLNKMVEKSKHVNWESCSGMIKEKGSRLGMASQHLTPKLLIEQGFITEQKLREYFTFCMVRNPWDRLVSAYAKIWHTMYNNFDEFLDNIQECVKIQTEGQEYLQTLDMVTIKDKASHINNNYNFQFKPQHLYLEYNGRNIMDYVARFENYNEDMKYIYEVLGLKNDNMWINKSERKNYTEYYTDKTKNLVGDLYQKDIEMFNYDF